MIELECSNCGRMQQLEAAFAGCICRCRFCQAIQTVPGADSAAGRRGLLGVRGPRLLHCPEDQRVSPSAARWWAFVALALIGVVAAGVGAVAFLVQFT